GSPRESVEAKSAKCSERPQKGRHRYVCSPSDVIKKTNDLAVIKQKHENEIDADSGVNLIYPILTGSWLSKYSISLRSDLISKGRSLFPDGNVIIASSSANSSSNWLGEEEVVLPLNGLITIGEVKSLEVSCLIFKVNISSLSRRIISSS
nr:hypothetical protein [Tanacetum cinerariifolium]